MKTNPTNRRVLPLALVFGALLVAGPAFAQPQSGDQQDCINRINKDFARLAKAQRKDIARCLKLGSKGKVTTTIEACVADDEKGKVAKAKAITHYTQNSRCVVPPDFGFDSAATTNTEAAAAEVDLIHDLLGPDLDAVVATGAAAKCQQALVKLVGKCTDAFLQDYNSCAKSALKAGADDEAALVQCKGSDRKGKVLRTCTKRIADGIAKRCAGQDLDTLVSGCAGVDHAACLGAKAVGEPSQALNASAAICEPVDLGLPAPPAPEPFTTETIPLPSHVLDAIQPTYLPDGEHLIARIRTTSVPDPTEFHMAIFKDDGTNFQCLTCGGPDVGKGSYLQVFPDGQRIFSSKEAVLECSPSLLDCQTATVVPIVYPPPPNGFPIQRVATQMSPDGVHVIWSQVTSASIIINPLGELVRISDGGGDRYELENVEVLTGMKFMTGPPEDLQMDFDAPGEAKGFSDGGRSVNVISSIDSSNFDIFKIDIATGAITRLTHHVGYDEGAWESPDGEWVAIQSLRPIERMHVFSEVFRPFISTLGVAKGAATYRNEVINPASPDRRRYYQLVLLDKHGDRAIDNSGGYVGQNLSTAPDNVTEYNQYGGVAWKPDSTGLVFWEQLRPELVGVDGIRGRLRKVTLTTRTPTTPLAPFTPDAPWAQRYDQPGGLVYPDFEQAGTVFGQVSGTATFAITHHPDLGGLALNGFITVDYQDFSDDGREFITGSEFVDYSFATGIEWDTDVKLTGCRQGSLRGTDIALSAQESAALGSGVLRSVLEGGVREHDLALGLPNGVPGELE